MLLARIWDLFLIQRQTLAKFFWKLRACPCMKVGSQVLSRAFCAMGAFAKGAKMMLCKGISGCTKWSHWSHSSAVSHLQCLIKKPGRCVGWRWARQILSAWQRKFDCSFYIQSSTIFRDKAHRVPFSDRPSKIILNMCIQKVCLLDYVYSE